MARIKRRVYGRSESSGSAVSATHVVQIGAKGKSKGGKEIPVRLRGFVVRRDSVDAAGNRPIDYAIMQTLGFAREQVDAGVEGEYKAPEVCLPKSLRIRIRWNATRESGTWEFPGTATEQYENWNKFGLHCSGDGVTATRKADDGTRRKIECNPIGTCANPCKISANKECKPVGRFAFVLLGPDDKPLGPPNSVFRFENHSDASMTAIGSELERAAEYCRGLVGESRNIGHIANIRGTMTVSIRTKRTGIESSPTANVPIVSLALDREDLEARRAEIWRRETALASAMAGNGLPTPAERAAIEAPSPPEDVDFAEVESEPAYGFSPDAGEETKGEELVALLAAVAEADGDGATPDSILREVVREMTGKPFGDPTLFFARRESDPAAHAKAMALLDDVLAALRLAAKPKSAEGSES